MRFPIVSTGAAVLSLFASPALAQERYRDAPPPAHDERRRDDAPGADYADGPGRNSPDYQPSGYQGGYRGEYPGFDPAARDAWLADCHDRIAPRDPGPGPGECEAYLDNYYASYTRGGYAARYAHSPAFGQPGCCARAMPIVQATPRCTETVEYVTEYIPVKTRHRAIPRRAKIVPDKRVKLTPIK